jgi:hypothetical protein
MAGCVGEAVVEFTQWIRPVERETFIGRLSALLLIAGLAVEILAQVQVNTISNREIAVLNKEAGEAYSAAAVLGADVKNLRGFVRTREQEILRQLGQFKSFADAERTRAEAIITDLNASRASLEKARTDAIASAQSAKADADRTIAALQAEEGALKNEKHALDPRHLTPEQEKTLVAELSRFKDTSAAVWRGLSGTSDVLPLSERLVRLLIAANWNARGVSVSHQSAGVGVLLIRRPGAPQSAKQAGDASGRRNFCHMELRRIQRGSAKARNE